MEYDLRQDPCVVLLIPLGTLSYVTDARNSRTVVPHPLG